MRNLKLNPVAAAVGVAIASSVGMVQTAMGDAVMLPVVQSGAGFTTFVQLTNTAYIGQSPFTMANGVNSGGTYANENLRFVFNYDTALADDGNGNVVLATGCQHIDLPGRTSDKDTMLWEVSTGTGITATQLLPDDPAFGAEASVAAAVTGDVFGTLTISNAWLGYGPITTGGGVVPAVTATGGGGPIWTGTGAATPNEGTLFAQAWVVDGTNGTMYSYNGINDPGESTTASATAVPAAPFVANAPDQHLLTIAPTFNGDIGQAFFWFPANGRSSYTIATAAAVTVELGPSTLNTYNGASLGQDGFWDHNEVFISGNNGINVPCGGISMPAANMMSPAHWQIAQHTGAVIYSDVLPGYRDGNGSTRVDTGDFIFKNGAYVNKLTGAAGGAVISIVSEPGIVSGSLTAGAAAIGAAGGLTNSLPPAALVMRGILTAPITAPLVATATFGAPTITMSEQVGKGWPRAPRSYTR